MGTASSSPRPEGPLAEHEAFAIATHWQAQLRGLMTLTTHDAYDQEEPVGFADADKSIVQHFEWVTFNCAKRRASPGTSKSSMEAARASVAAWLALSSCTGFGIRENPRFWKRVFSTLWIDDLRREFVDDVRMFENDERPFPSVRIEPCVGEEYDSLRAFFRAGPADREVHRVLKPLEPYVRTQGWWRREIPVEIIADMMKCWPDKAFLPVRQPRNRHTPAFQLAAVRARCSFDHVTVSQVAHAVASGAIRTTLHVPVCYMDTTPRALLAIEQAPEANQYLRISRLVLDKYALARGHAMAAICSVLPHTRTIKALEILRKEKEIFSNLTMAWLGYALFHSDTADNATLETLILGVHDIPADSVNILRLMAKGNNLLYIMGATTTMSSVYHDARLAPQTVVRTKSSRTSQVVFTSPREQVVSVCIASLEQLKSDPWTMVVVPGVAVGWVETKHITKVVSRPPGPPSLRRLELTERGYHEGLMESATLQILSVLGVSLTHLKIMGKVEPPVLQAVLKECPNLVALRVRHDGRCWSDPSMIQALPSKPRLRTLELVVTGPFRPLVAPQLGDLTFLRVCCFERMPRPFTDHREAILETLRGHRRVSHVCWSNNVPLRTPWRKKSAYLSCWKPKLCADWREWQLTSYGLLDDDVREVLDTAQWVLRLVERLAFLSTFHDTTTGSGNPLPQLTSDVVRLIFEFAASEIPRRMLVRHSNDDAWTY